ncbi:polyprenyl synthetase family protein [Streptomyces sp. NPDC021224]|uniref:polyprenyl synthetase family protein n=1 Tax=unclassified Streptomyces TaxID=2593676 RepID=UPI00379C0829
MSAVDADVPAAVGAAAGVLLRARVAQAAAIDAAFGRDVAGPVARFVLDGGKRMRPQLVWWAMRACAPDTAAAGDVAGAALQVAVGMELLQTCALLHDDVMDGGRVRRGRPAFHAAWDAAHGGTRRRPLGPTGGESAAVLAGDLALTWADDAVAAAPVPPDRAGALRAQWQLLRTELAAGQYLDVHGQATACRVPRTAVRTALLKSAMYSVQRPLVLGAVLAGAPAATVRALSAAGRCAGLAFQLRDDLNDVFGDPARTGRPPGADIRAGKPTYLVAVAFRRAGHAGDRQALRVLDACVGDPGLSDSAQDEVRRVLEATGARRAVESDIAGLTVRALLHLRGPGAGLGADARRRVEDLVTTVAGVPSPEGAAGREADVDPAIAAELAAAEEAADEEGTW